MKACIRRTARALRGNRGSGIVVVLVSMLFVMLLGSALLYTSYTSYLVKMTERSGKTNFYDASAAINQIMAGIQEKTSDAIADAYTYVLTTYSSSSTAGDPQAAFEDYFRASLLACTDAEDAPLIQISGSSYVYSAKGLYSFLSVPAGADVSVNGYNGSGADNVSSSVEINPGSSVATIVLKHVLLTYQYKGYETEVTTDISIDTPDYYQSIAEYTVSGLPDYALVAKERLISSGNRQISGNAYAGNVEITGDLLTLSGSGALITPGSIQLDAGASAFTQDTDSSVWANNLVVNSGGLLTLNGKTYVSNDLTLNGNSTAALSGDYFGFGNSKTLPNESSAILANGTGSKLDLTDAKKLFLAGNSFVSSQNNSLGASSVLMGESISSKSDQLLYLVPNSDLSGGTVTSNPQIFNAADIYDSASGTVKDLTSGISVASISGTSVLQLTYPLSGGRYVAYFFLKFDTVQHANDYFKAYFTAHEDTVADYLQKYLTITDQADTIQTRGYTVTGSGSDLTLQDYVSGDSQSSTAGRLAGFYENLCTNLTTTSSSLVSSATNPYDYYVDDAAVQAAGIKQGSFLAPDGTTLYWLVSAGDVTVPSGNLYSVIISSGNVIVNTNFTGLILCGGTVALNGNVNVGENTDIILSNMGTYLKSYGRSDGDEEDTKQSWNLDKLVYYQNWSKQ